MRRSQGPSIRAASRAGPGQGRAVGELGRQRPQSRKNCRATACIRLTRRLTVGSRVFTRRESPVGAQIFARHDGPRGSQLLTCDIVRRPASGTARTRGGGMKGRRPRVRPVGPVEPARVRGPSPGRGGSPNAGPCLSTCASTLCGLDHPRVEQFKTPPASILFGTDRSVGTHQHAWLPVKAPFAGLRVRT